MSVELQRALHTVMRQNQESVHEIKVIVHPDLLNRLRNRLLDNVGVGADVRSLNRNGRRRNLRVLGNRQTDR